MTRETRLHEFDDRDSLAQSAARAAAQRLAETVRAAGSASLSLCGGSTPEAAYRALSDLDAHWDRVNVTLSDERWVDAASEHSNERLARETLLRGKAAAARFIGLKTDAQTQEDAVMEAGRRLAAIARPITLGVLGLGEDGHTASLFPDAPGGAAALSRDAPGRLAAVEKPGPGDSPFRLTMTLPELAAHDHLIVLAHGVAKRAIIDAAIGSGEGPEGLPVAQVLSAARGAVDIFWAP